MTIELVEVLLWNKTVGAAALLANGSIEFNYDDNFISQGLEVAPFLAPLSFNVIKGKSGETYYGLPEFLADSLPDKFGNAIIDAFFAKKGIDKFSLTALDKLSYVGNRAMGALTFKPAEQVNNQPVHHDVLEIAGLVEQARHALSGNLDASPEDSLNAILSVGISAGGARAKAVIAYQPLTGEVRSGQVDAPKGFEHWLLKFDGVGEDLALGVSQKYGRIEYAYFLMAKKAGVLMADSQLLKENGRAHFMTKRFDRVGNEKLHMQSLCAMASLDFNLSGAHSYEQYFTTTQNLTNDNSQVEQAILRCFFNIVSRNQDDHTKNLSYLMGKEGQWSLSPAFDVTYAFNPDNKWTRKHQMSLAGKVENFTVEDLIDSASAFITKAKASALLEKVNEAVSLWPEYASEAGLESEESQFISQNHQFMKL